MSFSKLSPHNLITEKNKIYKFGFFDESSKKEFLWTKASAGIYVRVREHDGVDWGSYTTSFGYGSISVGKGVESSVMFSSVPASATATGTAGQISYDANYLYVCVSSNVWRRSAIATW